jgi:antitoxin VapB
MQSENTSFKVAKLFAHGGGQAVRLPAEFRFEGDAVYIRRDARNGNVILSSRPELSWMEFMSLRHQLGTMPADFLADRVQGTQHRNALESWVE